MTSAPCSPKCFPTRGPAANTANSTTRIPSNAAFLEFALKSPSPLATVPFPLESSRIRLHRSHCYAHRPLELDGSAAGPLRRSARTVLEISTASQAPGHRWSANIVCPSGEDHREYRVSLPPATRTFLDALHVRAITH